MLDNGVIRGPIPTPVREALPAGPRADLVERVKDALAALPVHFATRTYIEGLEAGDLFSLNSMLGGSIEIQVVESLNKLRAVWDPDEEWAEYEFRRSAQTFPDVRLVTESPSRVAAGQECMLGIELKGWYLLSREGKPSFRYTPNRLACDVHDLLVVVPWRLDNVLAGAPIVYAPFVESARFASDMRTYYWTTMRREKDEAASTARSEDYYDVRPPNEPHPYPGPKTKISDKAARDSGGNFGRSARSRGLMDDYISTMLEVQVAGIQARHWVGFFESYAEGAQAGELHDRIAKKLADYRREQGLESEELGELLELWVSKLALHADGDE
ncbi:hypothetical protein MUG78_17950 [Gordonia alkaliphila]|uniref:hypothetical protein n=1 Tax=Gordonia alkaliphila TaxID=1053547 RepID=UPI001FF5E0A2|nr:hypothetical protein [Gordonia alkaliphila]MCK0441286.1 hypothetical protein [Gordonia alkaliphila]